MNRRSNSSSFSVQEITFEEKPRLGVRRHQKRISLKRQGMLMRSDHLDLLRVVSADLAMDDYRFSGAVMVRAALAQFLALPVGDQVRVLESYVEREKMIFR